ncbi:Glyoxalase/Bleomycin resistance protein/Dihydroxybiphenyl dioxygenase [Sarocladium strictum]
MPIPKDDPRIRLLATAYVEYSHAEFEKAKGFLDDFGLSIIEDRGDVVYYGGYGIEPYVYVARKATGNSQFLGAAYEVESREELERATRIAGATSISKLDGPGGGEILTLTDPIGFKVHLVHGQTKREPTPMHLEKLTVNYEDEKPRKGEFQRFEHGPAPVHRWGHYGVSYPPGTYQKMFDWYTQTLALGVSDVVFKGEDPITCFFHIDRGLEFTDHHAFFFKPAKPGAAPNVAHAAFEVHDFDVQQLGHQHLTKKGYELCWGVGRHVLGSQVFDYWFDTSSFIVEHYADGDLVNSETKIAHMQAGPDALAVWGPPVPTVF